MTNFKRAIYPIHGAWDDEVEPIRFECRLYEVLKNGLIKDCRYPQKKCKNCPVYNWFNGNERYKPLLQELILGKI